ncbi:MAG TPA: GNAT family N-acetyltransferase [Caulobacteraceae bacterium]|nr:GNAT family N-acetyltransferase [Caulobacteraceae bacterium]
MLIDVVRPSALRAREIDAWTALQATDPSLASPFLSPHWAIAVERAQAGQRGEIRVAVLRDGADPVGFFPIRVVGQTAMPVGAPMCDYQGLIAGPDVRLDAKRLVEALGVHRLDFSHMLADQPAFLPYARGEASSYVIDVARGYQVYAARHRQAGHHVLKDIDKRRRKLQRELGPPRFQAMANCPDAFDILLDWKRSRYQSTGQTVIFDTPWTVALMRALHEMRDGDFGGALFTLHVGERPAAIQFHLRGARTLHAWIIAYDAAFERYSPGLMLFQEILRWMDETPLTAFDLGAGDYQFKQQLANARRAVTHGFVGRPSAASFMRGAQYGVRAAAERLPWSKVQALPGKAMRRLDLWRGLR